MRYGRVPIWKAMQAKSRITVFFVEFLGRCEIFLGGIGQNLFELG